MQAQPERESLLASGLLLVVGAMLLLNVATGGFGQRTWLSAVLYLGGAVAFGLLFRLHRRQGKKSAWLYAALTLLWLFIALDRLITLLGGGP